MAIEDDALVFLSSLSKPWVDLFKRVCGLDLASATLRDDLQRERNIDRTRPGFADFDPDSKLAIKPGDPASSLVYHALASPLVKPENAAPASYPTVPQLDLLENYILSLKPFDLARIPGDAVVAVFAYEYRAAPATTHRRQADFVLSRMGCSRLGEQEPVWDGPNRCWLNTAADGRFAVMPARYAAFLAVPRRRSPDGISVLGDEQDGDDSRTFLLPIRKLFDGPGCISGQDFRVSFAEFHRREKLRRIFAESGLVKPAGLDQPPFLRDSTQAEKIVSMRQVGASLLVSSKPEPLVRLARLPDRSIATFKVPPKREIPVFDVALNRDNGSPSTFMIITGGLLTAGLEVFLQSIADVSLRPRNAPEFVNMRHKVTDGVVEDLDATLGQGNFQSVIDDGGYDAALFEDSICDGCIIASVTGLLQGIPSAPAFSVIGAPKFFPYADEVDIQDWVDEFPNHNRKDQFKEGGPRPLHLGRFPPNLTLPRPDGAGLAFGPNDETLVAIVGPPYIRQTGQTLVAIRPEHRWSTYLSDGCSGVFAPGWDVTFAEQDGVRFYATFGLGSPFPEDVKLCAAANAFWPAASPDAARTFNRGPTAIPLLDSELGYHVDNPRRGARPASWGWDGEQGPFVAGNDVNFASMVRSDYVSNALASRFSGAGLHNVTSRELIARMDALRLCIQELPENSNEVSHTRLWLVHVDKLDAAPVAAAPLVGSCYRYEFVVPSASAQPTADKHRLLRPWTRRYLCYVADQAVTWAQLDVAGETGRENFQFRPASGVV